MSAYSETVNVIMKSRVRESRTHGSVRDWYREVSVYSTEEKNEWKIKRYYLIILTKFIQLKWELIELEET